MGRNEVGCWVIGILIALFVALAIVQAMDLHGFSAGLVGFACGYVFGQGGRIIGRAIDRSVED